jgi:hypothetical protein
LRIDQFEEVCAKMTADFNCGREDGRWKRRIVPRSMDSCEAVKAALPPWRLFARLFMMGKSFCRITFSLDQKSTPRCSLHGNKAGGANHIWLRVEQPLLFSILLNKVNNNPEGLDMENKFST